MTGKPERVPNLCTRWGPHHLPNAALMIDSTVYQCAKCDEWFVVCSIMGQGAHSRHWTRWEHGSPFEVQPGKTKNVGVSNPLMDRLLWLGSLVDSPHSTE